MELSHDRIEHFHDEFLFSVMCIKKIFLSSVIFQLFQWSIENASRERNRKVTKIADQSLQVLWES